MDIYKERGKWKIYLALLGIIIVLLSLYYTNNLAAKLAQEERKKMDIWLTEEEEFNDYDSEDLDNGCEVTLHLKIKASNTTIPLIMVDERGKVIAARNFGEGLDSNYVFLQKEVEKMKAAGFEPIKGFASFVYYKESTILRQLRYFPYIQLMLISVFVFFGYFTLNAARRSEQNRIWVGMAKETAHQLGTPISAIMAWIEHLKMLRPHDEDVLEVVDELEKDMNRLDLVADRFSKIGSEPKLEKTDIYEEMEGILSYMNKRASKNVQFNYPEGQSASGTFVAINRHLFDWVVENLIRNALDAMGGKGEISVNISEDNRWVNIDISDTGKGIPANKFKTVFQPGFTTKQRGWGLGLSLAKRIIEEYHKGRIFVKESTEGKGTTFRLQLPKAAG